MTIEIILAILSSAVVSAIITSLIAPHINWGIEKKRMKQENRKKLIQEVRKILNQDDFDKFMMRKSEVYTRIRAHLSKKLDKEIRSSEAKIIVSPTEMTTDDILKEAIHEEINKLEEKWELI